MCKQFFLHLRIKLCPVRQLRPKRIAGYKRLAKRDDARAIAKYRAEGATPQDIRRMVGLG